MCALLSLMSSKATEEDTEKVRDTKSKCGLASDAWNSSTAIVSSSSVEKLDKYVE